LTGVKGGKQKIRSYFGESSISGELLTALEFLEKFRISELENEILIGFTSSIKEPPK
jgi:hypothetical protein